MTLRYLDLDLTLIFVTIGIEVTHHQEIKD